MGKDNNSKKRLTVIDFFCGAGGFSEGFRMAGFDIVMGIDNWKPAIDTHNFNHGLNDTVKNILDFEDIEEINKLPNTDVIIGSPPCVLFSLSNHGGNADKSLGIRLIKAFYRVITVKKFQKNSTLKAWLMENVPNSRKYVQEKYTFADLDLSDWAIKNGHNPQEIVLKVKNNGDILCSNDYGSCQTRKRFVCGEIIKTGKFPTPNKNTKGLTTLKKLFSGFPKPTDTPQKHLITDPNYPDRKINAIDIHDHFYDTGVYEIEWMKAKMAKTNHPYMGKMSFPENMDKPSRTIMATRSASTRETILYKSDYDRKGDGEYRLPTIREAATIMGFPLDYQFIGNDESTKWRQIGNAVCVQLSYSLAKTILEKTGYGHLTPKRIKKDLSKVKFLDDYKEKQFNKPPRRNPKALFRMHPIKTGNMTVDLTNKKGDSVGKWCAIIHAGTGKGYKHIEVNSLIESEARQILKAKAPKFISLIENDALITYYPDSVLNKKNKEYGFANNDNEHPYNLIQKTKLYIDSVLETTDDSMIDVGGTTMYDIKPAIPLSQIMSIYALGKIVIN